MSLLYDVDFKIPIKKPNNYISYANIPIKFNLFEVKIKNIKRLTNSNGYSLNIYISPSNNKDIINNIIDIDKKAFDKIIKYNDTWFNNGLTENELIDLYRKSFCNQTNTVNCILSNNISYNIKINNTDCTDENKLLEILFNMVELKNYIISLEISHAGLFFYPELSINKWLIKSINIINIDFDPCYWNRSDIENDWENEVEETVQYIDGLIENKQKEIKDLIEQKNKINNIFKDIKKMENTDNLWENKIYSLKKLIIDSSIRILSNKDNR